MPLSEILFKLLTWKNQLTIKTIQQENTAGKTREEKSKIMFLYHQNRNTLIYCKFESTLSNRNLDFAWYHLATLSAN